jgi:hypothetical protein
MRMKKDLQLMHFRATRDVHDRLMHHSKRLGLPMANILRDGLLLRLQQLDDEEAKILATQAQRLDLRKARSAQMKRTTVPIPARIEKRFVGYAEALESCTTMQERDECSKEILEDIKARCSSLDEERRVCEAFKEFLTARKAAKDSSPANQLTAAMRAL